jgi:hypothetical protein
VSVISELYDSRINSTNYLIELTIGEYLEISKDILARNEFQRKRVKSCKTIYTLLKEDILKGCVIPPIVLALTKDQTEDRIPIERVITYIKEQKNYLLILDGLQRTHTIIDLESDLIAKGDESGLKIFYDHKLRIEIYVGLNRLGILYRMLTLNTGQTPMSLRQQIEILYLDYANISIDGIELIREADDTTASSHGQYNFKDMVEGFNSYLERNELPFDRIDILENVQGLEKLSKENNKADIFRDYLVSWHEFINKMNDLCEGYSLDETYAAEHGNPFGKNALQVFKKAQAVSGFGAAVGRLKDFGLISGFESIREYVKDLNFDKGKEELLTEINKKLFWINSNSKKIGNAQRMYFQYFFREIFNPQGDYFCKPDLAVGSAFQKYQSQI